MLLDVRETTPRYSRRFLAVRDEVDALLVDACEGEGTLVG